MHSLARGLLALGAKALWHDGDLRRARKLFESAYRRALSDGDPRAIAAAALGSAGLWVGEYESSGSAAEMLDRLRQAVPVAQAARDGRMAQRLQARLAAEADRRSGEHRAVLAELEHARRLGDPVVLAETLNLVCQCVTDPACGALRGAVADEYLVTSARTRRPGDPLFARLWQTVRLVREGSGEARQSLRALSAMLDARPNLTVEHCVRAIEAMYEVRGGRFERAERLARECAYAGVVTGRSAAPAWRTAHLVAVRWYQGRIGELGRILQAAAQAPGHPPADGSPRAWAAVAYAAAGEERRARAALAGVSGPAGVRGLSGHGPSLSALPRTDTWLVTMYGVAQAAHLLGDLDAAAQAYRLLLPYAGLPAVAGPAISCFGSVEHALGLAQLTLSDHAAAAHHLRQAVKQNADLDHLPAAALSRRLLAEIPL